MSREGESNSLHARVRAFARGAADDFDELALAIARFQLRHCPGLARLLAARGGKLESARDIPAVPSAAFRLSRVATHPPLEDAARFVTSGTTNSGRGQHCFRTLETYRELALTFGRKALLPAAAPRAVIAALAPEPPRANESSLGFMMQLFLEHFDGVRQGSGEFPGRWLLRDGKIDHQALGRVLDGAGRSGAPFLLLATSFALSALLDDLAPGRVDCPDKTFIMETGGFKGRYTTLTKTEFRTKAAELFGIPETHIIDEYGMTELSSQLYSGTLPGGAISGPRGIYLEPPWLRIVPVDPVSLEPVASGEVGLARIVDLGNVDSAVAILTEDRVRRVGPGIELLGRLVNAPERGCSLQAEALLTKPERAERRASRVT